MTWDYRLLAHQDELGHILYFAVHEVYYDTDGNPNGWTKEALDFTEMDEDPHEIVERLEMVVKSLKISPPLLIQEDTNTLEVLPLISKDEG
jgi:hypothetical protein